MAAATEELNEEKTKTIRTQSCSRKPRRFFNRRKTTRLNFPTPFTGSEPLTSTIFEIHTSRVQFHGKFEEREKRTHCHSEKCLFAPRSRPIFHFEKQIGWKISGDFWRKNGSSISRKFRPNSGSVDLPTFTKIYQTWRTHTNTYISLSGAHFFCTKRTRINKNSKCQIIKSP